MMKRSLSFLTLAMLTLAFAPQIFSQTNPTPKMETKTNTPASSLEHATFGGGCFWCMEAVYQRVKGVKSLTSGYAGGRVANPTYEQVCGGATGHAEVIQIAFDPREVSFEHLVELFWDAHDPTTLNRQGADSGTQYRSAIFYADDAQKKTAEDSRAKNSARFKHPIVTEIAALKTFYPAEHYHQNYYNDHTDAPYCQVVIRPKLEKLKEKLSKP
jgi:peptide-methionine (S)-S-oxide reductase